MLKFRTVKNVIVPKGGYWTTRRLEVQLEHLSLLVREERAIKVKSDLFCQPESLGKIEGKLIAHLNEKGEVTPNEFRELTCLSRKLMIPLLEYFDSRKLTLRVGGRRLLRKKLS